MVHENFMRRALELAALGFGKVSPNPMVGAVIVHNGKIIGEGYHEKYGAAHAEVNAINDVLTKCDDAAELLKSSSIYVTLEPCAHFGKTPPCTDLILKHQIPTVIIGCQDPFKEVDGKGVEKLRANGVEVISNVLRADCELINQRFFTQVNKQRPYIILKWAETADGFIGVEGQQQWISGAAAKSLVHLWRTQEDCVLIGKNTALTDNPLLNVRYAQGKNPYRAVIDRDLTLPTDLNIFNNDVKTFIFNAIKTDLVENTYYISIEDFDYFLPQYVLYQLYLQDIQSLIIEGGSKTLQSFIDARLWDEARIFVSDKNFGKGIQAPTIKGKILSKTLVANDELTFLKPLDNAI